MNKMIRQIKRQVLPATPEGVIPAVQLLESEHSYTFVHWEYGRADEPEHLAGALKVPKGVGEISVMGTAFYPTDGEDFASNEIPGQPLESGELVEWLGLIDRTLTNEKRAA